MKKENSRAKRERVKSQVTSDEDETSPEPMWPTPSKTSTSLRMSYHIGRGEQGVLTFEPYKSILLPHWRFKTVPIARKSSQTLHDGFDYYVQAQDFVGADMARKFIQMGMTRAGRYANRAGGRKYQKSADGSGERVLLPKTDGHKGQQEKREASEIFREVWLRCKEDEAYLDLKQMWLKELKEYERSSNIKEEVAIKEEGND
jgi:hypothetical protein